MWKRILHYANLLQLAYKIVRGFDIGSIDLFYKFSELKVFINMPEDIEQDVVKMLRTLNVQWKIVENHIDANLLISAKDNCFGFSLIGEKFYIYVPMRDGKNDIQVDKSLRLAADAIRLVSE